jgi:hypothetical protein
MSSLAERMSSDVSSVFLNPNDHGSLARFTHAGGASVRIHVIFTDRYEETDMFGSKVANTGPAAIAATDDVEDVAVGDILEVSIDGEWQTFYVLDPQEDESGLRTLKLSTKPLHG